MKRFQSFTDSELYMLKRQAMESSAEIGYSGHYNQAEIKTSTNLLNEIIDEIKARQEREPHA